LISTNIKIFQKEKRPDRSNKKAGAMGFHYSIEDKIILSKIL